MITSTSNRSFIEAEQYSSFILRNMYDGMMPDVFFRSVDDFGSGDTLNIKTIGEAQIQDITENEDPTYSPIETGNVTLTITDYVGDAWYITDKMRQDGSQIEALTQALNDQNTDVRLEAVTALGRIGNAEAMRTLIQALNDEDKTVRHRAVKILGEIKIGGAEEAEIEVQKDKGSDISGITDLEQGQNHHLQ